MPASETLMYRRTFLSVAAAALGGCSILPDQPPLKFYGFLPQDADPGSTGISHPLSTLKVDPPLVAVPYDSQKIFVLGGDNRFFNSDINRLVAQPSALIGDAVRFSLRKRGPWKTVLTPNSLGNFDYELTVYVPEFFVDATSKPFKSVIQIEFSLTKASDGKLLLQRSYRSAADIKTDDMSGAIEAFQQSLNDILFKFNSELKSALTVK